MAKVPCSRCAKPFAEVMLENGMCPRCQSEVNENFRKEQKPQYRTRHDSPEARKEWLDKNDEAKRTREEAARRMRENAERLKAHRAEYAENSSAYEQRYAQGIEQVEAQAVEHEIRKMNARQELAKRELARRHLVPFVQYETPSYSAGWLHHDIGKELQAFSKAVERGESPRLMITVPPRHGKSMLATQRFPAWHLGRCPTHEFIVASYSASLANKFSKITRALLRSESYQNVFDTRLNEDDASVEGWSTTEGGAYFPTGVGGPATGRGCHVLVIDDPVKNREEAESETVRESIKDWYTSTAYTRLAPGGGVLIIQTRWHDDDLAGWLRELSDKDEGDHFRVVDYPAIAEEDEKYRKKGEALHEARYPLESLLRIKKAVGNRDWNALYQQKPVPDSGEYFKRDDLRYYTDDERPALEDLAIYAAADYAIGQNQRNDSTVIYVAGIDRDRHMWILDRYKGQWGTMMIIKNLCLMYRTWRPELTGGEEGHIKMAIDPVLQEKKYLPEYNAAGLFLKPLKPGRQDKMARARPFQDMVESHMVHFPLNAPWIADMEQEVLRFPSGKHDDDVDALAWLGQMINLFSPKPTPREEKLPSWRDKLDQYVAGGGGRNSWLSS